jgi:hypothetical protein
MSWSMKSVHLTQLRGPSSVGSFVSNRRPTLSWLAGGSFVREIRPMLHRRRAPRHARRSPRSLPRTPRVPRCIDRWIRLHSRSKSLAISMTKRHVRRNRRDTDRLSDRPTLGEGGRSGRSGQNARPKLRHRTVDRCFHACAPRRCSEEISHALRRRTRPGITVIEQTARALFVVGGTRPQRCAASPWQCAARRLRMCHRRTPNFSVLRRVLDERIACNTRVGRVVATGSGGPWSTSATERSRRLRL